MSVEADGIIWEIGLPLRPATASPGSQPSPSTTPPASTPWRPQARAVENAPPRLTGKCFLVVEDEPLVALDIVAGLKDGGAQVAGPVGTIKDALHVIDTKSFDAALLDGNVHGQPVDEIAAALTRRRVPFVFVTGYGPQGLPRAFATVAILSKPFTHNQLLDAAAALVDQRSDVIRLRE